MAGREPGAAVEGRVTIAIPVERLGLAAPDDLSGAGGAVDPKRILDRGGLRVVTLVLVAAAWVGLSLYRIDHAVHHVGVSAAVLARGKNDLLAIVKGPDHSEQVFVFHAAGGHTNVLQIPQALGLPLAGGPSVPLETVSLHVPAPIVAGLDRPGHPREPLRRRRPPRGRPDLDLGRLATGKLAMRSMLSDPIGTSSILQQVAAHVYLGPGTPVSAVLSLMNVPTPHPVSVPTARDVQGHRPGRGVCDACCAPSCSGARG